MRAARTVLPVLLVGLAACATPAIRLTPAFVTGETRLYRLEIRSATTLSLPSGTTSGRAELAGRSMITVVSTGGEETELHLSVRWDRYLRDGARSTPPAEQTADLIVGPDGRAVRITAIGGVPPAVAGADVSSIAPLLGPSLPTHRVHLGDRWTANDALTSGARQEGRITALEVVGGYRCAIVRVGVQRPITRTQAVGQQQIELTGTEFSTSEIAFAFRSGFAVRVETAATARFTVRSATFSGGSLEVENQILMEKASA